MKTSLFYFLLAASLIVPANLSHAQETATATAEFAAKSGFALLLEARELLKNAPNDAPATTANLAHEENRLAIERNAPALAKLREALRLGIEVPPPKRQEDYAETFRISSSARELARLLGQEADVHAAEGDAEGAARSGLDVLKLGDQTGRGSLMAWMSRNSIIPIGQKVLETHASQLNAAQSRLIAAEWERIAAQRATLAEVLAAEAELSVSMQKSWLADPNWKERLRDFTTEANQTAEELTPQQLETNTRRLFKAAIERAALPYQDTASLPQFEGEDPLSNLVARGLNGWFEGGNPRFVSEHQLLTERLAIAALKLRAIKLETGAYPAEFDAGTDPFSPTLAPLIYKREGNSFLLYSVGPDGKDEEGSEIQTLETNPRTGIKTVTGRLMPNSMGDIVAPIFEVTP